MDLASYQSKMNQLDAEADELAAQLRKLQNELADAEQARQSAIKFRNELNGFVSSRKTAKNKPAKNPMLKAFQSFAQKAESLLSGNSYYVADDKAAEMKRVADRKIKRFKEDIAECQKALKQLNQYRQDISDEYRAEQARMEAQQQ